tara:strand:- start:1896 stop:2726 length:831 start_codon:yes stop_codon:yes gene_type:complete
VKKLIKTSSVVLFLIFSAYLVFVHDYDNVPVISVIPVEKFPHDKTAFTQGFEFHKGSFYEGTGLRGQSNLKKIEVFTGKVLKLKKLDSQYFGEGITIFKEKIYQLTWQSGKGFVYDLETFKLIREFNIKGEGWGLTNDGTNLIMSNGSDEILFLDPESFKVVRKLSVKKNGRPEKLLNELELIKGNIWANVWKTDDILIIDAETGEVVRILNLSKLSERTSRDDVANGIAWDEEKDIVYVTGKLWKNVYKLQLNNGKAIKRSIFDRWYNQYKHVFN